MFVYEENCLHMHTCRRSSVCVYRCVSLLKVHVWIFESVEGDI